MGNGEIETEDKPLSFLPILPLYVSLMRGRIGEKMEAVYLLRAHPFQATAPCHAWPVLFTIRVTRCCGLMKGSSTGRLSSSTHTLSVQAFIIKTRVLLAWTDKRV